MGVRKPSEERWFPRYYEVTGPFPGRLLGRGDVPLEVQVLDVSRDGLGILLKSSVRAGDVVELEIDSDGKRVAMTIVYCVPDLIHKTQFRCGLHRKPGTSAENLVQVFAAKGCIQL